MELCLGIPIPETIASPSIILSVRLPRVICVALTGASLSLCGGAMQGLLRNPLADGSTLGVSSGAALGAAFAIAFGIAGREFASNVLKKVEDRLLEESKEKKEG